MQQSPATAVLVLPLDTPGIMMLAEASMLAAASKQSTNLVPAGQVPKLVMLVVPVM
jgi:hypothetical protein